MMTVKVNEHLLKRKTIEEIKDLVKDLSLSIVRTIVQRDYEGLAIRVISVEKVRREIDDRKLTISDQEKDDLLELKGRIDQLTTMINLFLNQDVNTSTMESLDDILYSYSILDIIKKGRDSQVSKDTLHNKLAETDGVELTAEELDSLLYALNRLNMVEVNDNTVALTQAGENLFSIYTANKKFTNKYERIKRKTQRQRRIKVDHELLERIEGIKNGFNTLSVMYNFVDEELEVEEIADTIDLSVETVKEILNKLALLKLVEEREADDMNTFTITKYGVKIFTLYKESKRYTNKYEKIKRKESKLIESW